MRTELKPDENTLGTRENEKNTVPQARPKRKLVVFALYILGKAKIICACILS
jgi:hypothetical protein